MLSTIKRKLFKLFLWLFHQKKYWRILWDQEAKELGNKLLDSCCRSPTSHLERQRYLLKILAPNSDDTFLDVGCAGGPILNSLSEKVRLVLGIDLSFEMLKVAKAHLKHKTNTFLTQADITNLPFADSKCSKILCYSVLHYLDKEKIETAISEIFRVTSKDGVILIGDLPQKDGKGHYFRFRPNFFEEKEILSIISKYNADAKIVKRDSGSFDVLIKAKNE